MKQLLIEIDPELNARLERAAPPRHRSEFIRVALRKALWEIEEAATAAAYRRAPDDAGDAYLDPRVWEARPRRSTRRR